MRNRTLLIVMLCAAGLAHAEGTVGDLSNIQSETLLLKAMVEQAAAQSELNAKSSVNSHSGDGTPPVVKSVYGVGDQLTATFLYSTGVMMDAKQGDTILGGFKVVSVGVDKVELMKGKQRLTVGFAATAPTHAVPTAPFFPTMPGPVVRPPLPGRARR